ACQEGLNSLLSLGTQDLGVAGAVTSQQSCAHHDQPAREDTAAAPARELRREVRAAARDAGEPATATQRDDLPPPREGSGGATAEPPAKGVPEEEKPGERCWEDTAGTGGRSTCPPGPLLAGGSRTIHPAPGTQTLTNPSAGVKDSSQQTDCGIAVLNKEMLQLSNYLKEALHRELLLKQKMVILQELFSTLLQASEKSWQGQLNEDKLKCKLQALENQLQACTQSYSKECVKKILIEMEDQKQTYEQKAKEALQKMLEDKLQTEQQLQNSQVNNILLLALLSSTPTVAEPPHFRERR
uniref:TRAF3 interacting protein 3 n=1 Tax=Calidris pygmaea TaxID=425635 RepID=A0A8C3KRN1_9CHAR